MNEEYDVQTPVTDVTENTEAQSVEEIEEGIELTDTTSQEEEKKEVATPGCGGGFLTEEEAQALSSRLGEVYAEAERCGFTCTAREIDELTALAAEHGAERVCDAIRIASDRGKPNLGYLRGILARDESSATDKHGEAYDPTGGLGWL